MGNVDGFVAAVPTASKEIYRSHARAAGEVFKEHGAVSFVECWGDDVPDGEVTSFAMAVHCKEDETVVFSWIVWASRSDRDRGMEKVMADPPLAARRQPHALRRQAPDFRRVRAHCRALGGRGWSARTFCCGQSRSAGKRGNNRFRRRALRSPARRCS